MPKSSHKLVKRNTLGDKVKRLSKIVHRTKPDLKYFYNLLSSYDLDDAGFEINTLQTTGASTFITLGSAENQRNGDSVKQMAVDIRYNIFLETGVTQDNTNSVRVLLVKDRSTAGAFPVLLGDILDPTGLASGSEIVAPRNKNNLSRFKILYDKTHSLSQGGIANVNVHLRKRMSGKTTFSGNTGAIGDLQNNHYWFCAYSDSTANLDPQWNHSITTQFMDA